MIRNGMSHREAGLLGVAKTRERLASQKAENIRKYNENPRLCERCGQPIDYEHRANRFCSHSCAAIASNAGREVTIEQRYNRSIALGGDGHKFTCVNCGKLRASLNDPFCSPTCREEYESKHKDEKPLPITTPGVSRWDQIKATIESTGEYPYCVTTNDTRRRVVRKYLEETVGHKCSKCGITTWNGQPVPLVVDHIDGDSSNHSVDNLRLLCYNCDAQTDTFKRRGNRTSTRRWREKYFK